MGDPTEMDIFDTVDFTRIKEKKSGIDLNENVKKVSKKGDRLF